MDQVNKIILSQCSVSLVILSGIRGFALLTLVNILNLTENSLIKEIVNIVKLEEMKKLIGLSMLLALILSSCAERKSDGSWEIDREYKAETVSRRPYIEIIDSCEYVIWGRGMAHKGNCKFCEARRDVVPGPPVEEDYGENEEY